MLYLIGNTGWRSIKDPLTDFVCHTTSVENAEKILKCGSLLSPVLARQLSAEELAEEPRNAAGDPPDYFQYIMFAWGNCQAGDRLVMERKLQRFPNDNDLSDRFTPGVRFYFRYDKLIRHPNAVFEGVLPLKIRDEVTLKNWVFAIIASMRDRELIAPYVPADLQSRVHYLSNNSRDIWGWSEMVYEYVKSL